MAPPTIIPLRPTNRLRQLREAADESRGRLAHALGVGSALIKQWERGQLSIPDERARVLAHRYGVAVAYLLREEKPIHGPCPMCGAERARRRPPASNSGEGA